MLDKDKIILVANICVSTTSKERALRMMNSIKEYLENKFDDSVKVLVFPVLEQNMQKIEILNCKNVTDEVENNFNEQYENILNNFVKKI
jgi:predicted transcriptional regulator